LVRDGMAAVEAIMLRMERARGLERRRERGREIESEEYAVWVRVVYIFLKGGSCDSSF